MKETLYSITEEYLALMDEIEQNEGELTEEMAERLNINEENYISKLEAYAQCIANYKAEAEACKQQAEHFAKRAKSAEGNAQRLKDTIVYFMTATGRGKESAGAFKFSIRESKAVDIIDEQLIPISFKKYETKETICKTDIKKAIEDGEEVPGAAIKVNKSITIK